MNTKQKMLQTVQRAAALAFAALIMATACCAFAGDAIEGVVSVTDTKGKKYKIRDAEFSDNGLAVRIGIPALSFTSPGDKRKDGQDRIQRIIPLDSVRSLTFRKGDARTVITETELVTTGGATQSVLCGHISLKGKQDLGELGTGDFSIAMQELSAIEFDWQPKKKSQAVALWPSERRSSDSLSGTVTLAGGGKLSFPTMTFYYQTSGSSCPIHSWCVGCASRTSWTTGHTTAQFDTTKDKTQVKLDLHKVKSLGFTKGADLAVVLRSGTSVEVERRTEGYGDGVLARDTDGWTFVPLKLIERVEFD
jgi:hypothetical protein